MLRKIIWITFILSLMLHATTERNTNGEKEYIHCFDGQLSFIKQKHHLFYSSQNNKFLTKENASRDSCKKQYLTTKKHAIACTEEEDIIKSMKNLQKKNQVLYPSCLVLNEELNLVVSAHAYYYKQLSYYHIKYKGHNLFIPKPFASLTKKKISKHTTKHYKTSKSKNHRQNKHLHKKKKYKYTKRQHRKVKHRKVKHRKVKHRKVQHRKVKHDYNTYSHNYNDNYNTQQTRSTQKNINNTNKSYTYKCLGSHGDVDISATDDSSISMASDILWRMCQKLKTEDEVCKIRDCYKLIR